MSEFVFLSRLLIAAEKRSMIWFTFSVERKFPVEVYFPSTFSLLMGANHTSYLSQTPQTCLCKNFLPGVNFSRMSEKNAYI